MDSNASVVLEQFKLGNHVPVALWRSAQRWDRRPLLLMGHGGSQHKTAPAMQQLAEQFVKEHGFVVAAIDGPIHGERRETVSMGLERQREFLQMWEQDNRIPSMRRDWQSVLDALADRRDVDREAIGWYGISMGTAYGIPLLAADERIKAAVLGMWGLGFMNSVELGELAPKVRCPVLFLQKWDDQFFSRSGQLELFDRLGAERKWLKIYMGDHGPLVPEQVEDILHFMGRHLNRP